MLYHSILTKFKIFKGQNTKAKSARGVAIMGFGTFTNRLLRLLRNAILARLLTRADFGLMALVMTTSLLFEYFTEVGVRQSIIHSKRGDEYNYLKMAWWFQSIRGCGLYVIAYMAAPWVGIFYKQPELIWLLRVAFLSIIFNSFISPRFYLLQKKFRFGKATLINQGSGILGTILSITIACWIRNIWALVIGFTAEAFFRCTLSYIFCPFMPKRNIHYEHLREILKYAKGMFGLPILAFLSFQIDILVLGKCVNKSQLGMYALAVALARAPADAFYRMFTPVLLSFYAEKQDDKPSLRRAALGITRGIAIFGMPLLLFLILSAREVLTVVYTSKYASVSLTFVLLVGFSFIMALSIVPAALYQGIGSPHLHRRFVIIRFLILASFIYPLTRYLGLSGAAATVLVANVVAMLVQIFQMRQILDIPFDKYLSCLSSGLLPAGIIVMFIILNKTIYDAAPLDNVIFGGVCCFVVWMVSFIYYIHNQKEQSTPIQST